MPTYGQRKDTQSQVDEHITDALKTSAKKVLLLGRDSSDILQDVYVSADGSVKVDISGGNITSATNTKVTVGATSTTVLALNASRVSAMLVNDSDEEIYINLSGTAIMNEGIRLNANGGSLVETEYSGIITAICSSGSKNLTVVEL